MVDLLDLSRVAALRNGDDAVLVEPLVGPDLGRGRLLLEGAHDVNVVRGGVPEGRSRDEYLVAPEDAKATLAGVGVDTRVAYDRLEDRDRLVRAVGQLVTDWEFLLIIVPMFCDQSSIHHPPHFVYPHVVRMHPFHFRITVRPSRSQ